jgi:hypothetical protein
MSKFHNELLSIINDFILSAFSRVCQLIIEARKRELIGVIIEVSIFSFLLVREGRFITDILEYHIAADNYCNNQQQGELGL